MTRFELVIFGLQDRRLQWDFRATWPHRPISHLLPDKGSSQPIKDYKPRKIPACDNKTLVQSNIVFIVHVLVKW